MHDESRLAFVTLYNPAFRLTPLKALGTQQEAKLNDQHSYSHGQFLNFSTGNFAWCFSPSRPSSLARQWDRASISEPVMCRVPEEQLWGHQLCWCYVVINHHLSHATYAVDTDQFPRLSLFLTSHTSSLSFFRSRKETPHRCSRIPKQQQQVPVVTTVQIGANVILSTAMQ